MAELKSIPLDKIKTVTNNGQTYTVIGNSKIIKERGVLNTHDLLLAKYREIQNEPEQKKMFDSMSPDEQQQYLVDAVIDNYRKTYMLKNGIEQAKPQDRAEKATKAIADKKLDDAYSNQELGIIESNGVITTVEEQPNGTINVNEVNNYNNDSINVSVSTDGTSISDSSSSVDDIDSDTITTDNSLNNLTSITSDTYLSNDNSEIVSEVNDNSQTIDSNNEAKQDSNTQSMQANMSHNPNSTRFVRTLRPRTLQPNQRYRAVRPNGFIENSIIVTILVLSTVLGLIIGSIIALYK